MNIGLYEAGIEHNEEVTKAIVQRVCFNEEKMSASLITMVNCVSKHIVISIKGVLSFFVDH